MTPSASKHGWPGGSGAGRGGQHSRRRGREEDVERSAAEEEDEAAAATSATAPWSEWATAKERHASSNATSRPRRALRTERRMGARKKWQSTCTTGSMHSGRSGILPPSLSSYRA